MPQTHKGIGIVGERPFQTVSGEKAVSTTLLTYVSAGGLHVPTMVIFKASSVKPEWRDYVPSGYSVRALESLILSVLSEKKEASATVSGSGKTFYHKVPDIGGHPADVSPVPINIQLTDDGK